jgi:hypothetical protein
MSTDTTAAPAAPEAPPAAPAALPMGDDLMKELTDITAARQAKEASAKPTEPAKPEEKPAEAPPAAEAKPPEAEKPPEEDAGTKARLALRQREAAIAQKEADLAAREKALETKGKLPEAEAAELAELRSLKQSAKTDPIGYLEAGGLTAQEVFEAVKRGRAPVDPAAKAALEKAQALEKRLAEQDAARAKAEEAAGLERYRNHITDTIKTGGDKFEFLAAKGSAGVQAVQEAALEFYQRHGKAPDLTKVAEALDKFYEEDFKGALKLKRAQGHLKPAAPPAPAPAKPAEPAPTTTLTNGMDGRPPAAAPGKKSPTSYDEQILQELSEIQAQRGAHG